MLRAVGKTEAPAEGRLSKSKAMRERKKVTILGGSGIKKDALQKQIM
jgi:hypothetical protein